MKKLKYMFIAIFLVLPMISMISLMIDDQKVYSDSVAKNNKNAISESASPGVSNYTITNFVEYDVEINFTLLNEVGMKTFGLKFDYLNDRQPNNTLTTNCPEYQKSQLLYHNITGYKPGELKQNFHDNFNNTFDEFNATLSASQKVSYDAKYNITLNALTFNSNPSIGTYDTSDEIFSLYCNSSNQIFNRTDNNLITASNSICSGLTNPIDKAQAIINWVSNNIIYQVQPKDQGASWAYDHLRGDCSEYSSLMVTLLRIQNIPARRILGFLLSNDPKIKPQIGDTWTFQDIINYTDAIGLRYGNFLRHAWIEYYVPDVGWIACDPTWHTGAYDYFNKIDYLRFTEINGDWFIAPNKDNVSEFCNPGLSYPVPSTYDMEYIMKITVTDTDVIPFLTVEGDGDDDDKKSKDKNELFEFLLSPIGLFLIVSLVSTVVVIIIVLNARRKEKRL